MPQKLSAIWHAHLGELADDVHQQYVNNVGNITLIRHNQGLGNRSFQEKRALYLGRSGLQVTQNYVVDQEVWDDQAIQRRQIYLVKLLVKHALLLPGRFQYSSNWNQVGSRSSQFDSRQVLNRLIGEAIQFISQPTITARVVGDSKVLFEGKEWNLSPLTRELKLRDGTNTRSGAYQGALYWSWDDTRLIDLE
ncbi:DUF1524 domain-containing protein [Flaviflexus ciconiae]|uniref:DUF1524 domain-containing protein n=2 Tax=Flaviflexus ciconiae TaxID=2496867 RepID=A0A3S9PVD5_9ACTO|nr:DUF1524 domain-containing protein [Flaviflexus ciconiae]